MPAGTHAEGARGAAVVLVRNAVDHDSRVLREARTLASLGFRTTVLGVVSFTQDREVTKHDGVTVRRIGPGSRLGWAVYREISSLRPAAAGGLPAGLSGSEGTPAAGDARGAPTVGAFGNRVAARPRAAARRVLRWLSTLAYYARAIPAVAALRPELVHCNDYNTMWIGVAARLLRGSAVVYDCHELWADRNLRSEPRWWLVACEALFVRLADRVVTTSPAYAEELARRYRVAPPAVVRNVPDWPEPSPSAATGDGRADRVAIYVGGLQPGRGIEQAIRAVALTPDVRLRLLGPASPEYRARLEHVVGALDLGGRVRFERPVAPGELLEKISGAGVGLALIEPVSLSYRLTLPNKLFEYALAGVPVLGSDLPMIASFIDEHGVGRVVDPEDSEAIAAALVEMLDPEQNRRYRRAAHESRAALDWRRERQVLADLYESALRSRRR